MDEQILQKDFREMTTEEKEKFVRELIHSDAASVKAAFLNPRTGKSVDIHELVDDIGEEKVVELLMNMFEHSGAQPISMTGTDVNKLMEKKKAGKLTEEEKMIVEAIEHSIMHEHPMQMQSHLIESILDLVELAQNDIHYNPTLFDIFSGINMLAHVNLTMDESLATSKFKYSSVDTIIEISKQIADDIMDTWKASCTEEVDDSIILLGLLHAIVEIAGKNNYELLPAKKFQEVLGINSISEEGNGSNEKESLKSSHSKEDEDKKMRNLLKD